MAWVNYHSHCNYCDGSDEPERYVLEAFKKDFPAYGFSSHASLPFPTDWSIPEDRFGAYLSEINRIKQKYRNRIQVYRGLEVDFIPGITGNKKLLSNGIKMDYLIESVHFIDGFTNGDPWSFDGSIETFQKGFEHIFHKNGRRMVGRYYELVRQMIEEDTPEIIGHLDKIKMHNHIHNYLNENDAWYRKEVEETIKSIQKTDAIVEVNTRGYYKSNRPEQLYPDEWILELLKQKNIRVMINADTHDPDEVDAGFEYAAEILKKIGFKYIWALFNGEWKPYLFDKNGIKMGEVY
jgi:histidinol-phosphatase (PHP family)